MSGTVFIACSKTKRSYACKALDLYCSPLFQKSLKYAITLNPERIYILSALYGVITPEQIIAPYNRTLMKMTTEERMNWRQRRDQTLRKLKPPSPWILLGGRYYLEEMPGTDPLKGYPLGTRLQWLNKQLNKKMGGFNLCGSL